MRKENKEIEKLKKMLENEEIDEATFNRQLENINDGYGENEDTFLYNNFLKILLFIIFIVIVIIMVFLIKDNIKGNTKEIEDNKFIKTDKGFKYNIEGGEIEIRCVSAYKIVGRVVGKKEYFGTGMQDRISPIDIAMVTGKLEDKSNYEKMKFTLGNRTLYWSGVFDERTMESIGGEEYLNKNIRNNHVIPKNDNITETLRKVNVGDKILLEGYLVDVHVKYDNGQTWYWDTSKTREDTGNGACETFLVTNVHFR